MIKETSLHPLAWLVWVAAIGFALSATRNPLYLGLILLCVLLAVAMLGLPAGTLRFMIGLFVASILFNGLSSRNGQTILFVIPSIIPLLGGPMTLESLVYGALTGLALAGVVAVLRLAQAHVPTRTLLDLLPVAFAPIAVTLTIAIAFIPTTIRQLGQIQEAQAIRGHRIRGLRDWLALLIPLLIGGLDRAFQLAEALAARGFPAYYNQRRTSTGPFIAVGLGLGLAGLLANAWGFIIAGLLVGGSGVGLVGIALFQSNRSMPYTRYRQYHWQWRDRLVIASALSSVLLLTLPLPLFDHQALLYSPYPTLHMPLFQPIIGICTLGLAGMGIALLFEEQS